MTQTIVLATHNPGKLVEIQDMLKDLPFEFVSQTAFGIGEVEETGTTYIENAIIKARHAAEISGLPALADDSGLSVDYLNGAPGVRSARYAGKDASNTDRIKKLLNALNGVAQPDRQAHFHCVMALMRSAEDPAPLICHGTWRGHILTAPRGDKGFGYDPIFFDETEQCSAAELELNIKNQISHRGQAIKQFKAALNQ